MKIRFRLRRAWPRVLLLALLIVLLLLDQAEVRTFVYQRF